MILLDPLVVFLLKSLREAGCPFSTDSIRCVPCVTPEQSGVYIPPSTIQICENNIQSKTQVRDTIAHELIHAFDFCRIHFDMRNCFHLACSEIRAANLSGDCNWSQEILRGNLDLKAQHQKCVARRAILSLSQVEECKSKNIPQLVNQILSSCLNDTEPFIERP